MTVFPLDDIEDLLLRQEIEQIFSDTAHIAEQLDMVWRGLDACSYRLDSAVDRGAMSRIARAAADAALTMRRPR